MRPINSGSYMLMSCTTAPGSRVQTLRVITRQPPKESITWKETDIQTAGYVDRRLTKQKGSRLVGKWMLENQSRRQ